MEIPYSVWALVVLAMATGLLAGVFLTFSDFVMKSLLAAKPAAGSEAMQIINRKVYNSIFMVLFLAMVPVSAGLAVYASFYTAGPLATVLIIAGLLYFFGVFVVTVIGNVPMNNALEALPQGGDDAQAYWPEYVKGWVLWNHLRWVTALGASVSYVIAAMFLMQSA
jgi:uncharacterized membrane protein